MNDITQKYGYVKKQIPDPQVKDAADQFWTAADLLRAQPPGSGVLLPEIINSVLALELYLKSVSSYSIIKDLEDYGNGVRGGVVTAQPEKSTHKLSQLYDTADDWVRTELESEYSTSTLYQNGKTLRDLLLRHDNVFVAVRYVYEDSDPLRSLNIAELHQLAQLMKGVVETLARKTTILK
ncbi:hypothetical protein JHS3_13560 [Jeongeupia sp. HS-3]|uniref:hypothetical protein n=1 Tax=Jeongeupia sp. HS-3 TaxID=1009682 RepID=UPI0018A3B8E2|nr:hypothetical protein [Jeongeupia sp. HS-3]BCL75620.1 hypothetical protein JHS3_13560 [Jeongeupia sp. HS-3]